MTVIITIDAHEAVEFELWLESKGYNVEYGIESAIDGVGCSCDEDANNIHNELWNNYCTQ